MSDPEGREPGRLVRVELVVAGGEEPVSGTIRGPGGDCSSFSGWLELLAILDEIVGA